MKKTKFAVILIMMCMLLGFGGSSADTKVEAALTNVLKAPKAKAGTWVIHTGGYRYRYKKTGEYAKSKWLKIDGNIYYFRSTGYLQTGWLTYNKKKYYFNEQGVLQIGWLNYKGGKYYLSKYTGEALTGKKMIGTKYYYFSSSGVRQTGWKKIGSYYYYFYPSNGSMAVSTKIGSYYVDKNGRRTTKQSSSSETSSTQEKLGKVDFFVGDSRTVGLGIATGKSNKCIAKVGMGYDWFVKTAEPKLRSELKKKASATVVFNFGINDEHNYNKYIARYKKLIKDYPKAHFYFMSVNPFQTGYGWNCTTAGVKKFNSALKKAFPDKYIDSYTYLTKKGYSTVDGLHYTTSTYKTIYNYVLGKV